MRSKVRNGEKKGEKRPLRATKEGEESHSGNQPSQGGGNLGDQKEGANNRKVADKRGARSMSGNSAKRGKQIRKKRMG